MCGTLIKGDLASNYYLFRVFLTFSFHLCFSHTRAEIRVQFRHVPGNLYNQNLNTDLDRATNELVIRVQPDEAIYLKINNKVPGLGMRLDHSNLNLHYAARHVCLSSNTSKFLSMKIACDLFTDLTGEVLIYVVNCCEVSKHWLCILIRYSKEIPDAYERLLLDAIGGERRLFIRSDELDAAWALFTPLLEELEEKKVMPEYYPYGSRGPVGAHYLAARYNVRWGDLDADQ